MRPRRCSRASCSQPAVATLTYVYGDSTAVVGPLATQAEPHCYDLCGQHASALSVPRGWEVIRLAVDVEPKPSTDDLLALADAVREVGLSYDQPPETPHPSQMSSSTARGGAEPGDRRGRQRFGRSAQESGHPSSADGPSAFPGGPSAFPSGIVELGRRGHLTVLADPDA